MSYSNVVHVFYFSSCYFCILFIFSFYRFYFIFIFLFVSLLSFQVFIYWAQGPFPWAQNFSPIRLGGGPKRRPSSGKPVAKHTAGPGLLACWSAGPSSSLPRAMARTRPLPFSFSLAMWPASLVGFISFPAQATCLLLLLSLPHGPPRVCFFC